MQDAQCFSGGGWHLYWKLKEVYALVEAEDIARHEYRLKGLADFFGADMAATDASRVMRIPGTVNWPNELKRVKGRVSALCSLVDHVRARV